MKEVGSLETSGRVYARHSVVPSSSLSSTKDEGTTTLREMSVTIHPNGTALYPNQKTWYFSKTDVILHLKVQNLFQMKTAVLRTNAGRLW